jgi:hypothetical protein
MFALPAFWPTDGQIVHASVLGSLFLLYTSHQVRQLCRPNLSPPRFFAIFFIFSAFYRHIRAVTNNLPAGAMSESLQEKGVGAMRHFTLWAYLLTQHCPSLCACPLPTHLHISNIKSWHWSWCLALLFSTVKRYVLIFLVCWLPEFVHRYCELIMVDGKNEHVCQETFLVESPSTQNDFEIMPFDFVSKPLLTFSC